jgi:hypothetical protein
MNISNNNKTILSFDIGIKNLAFCLLDDSGNIHDWGIIDLINDETDLDNNKCKFTQKNKKICNKKSYCCIKENIKTLDSNICENIIPLCKTHSKNYKEEDLIINKSKKKCNTKSSKDICITLINKLNEKPNFINLDYIVIENQPSTKNPTMKTIQVMIYTYFINKCMIENNITKDIVLLAPRNKLTVYEGPEIECNVKNKYTRTKKLGIEYCKIMIEGDKNNSELFKKHLKKDDLADCYLQGMFYIKNVLKYKKSERVKKEKGDIKEKKPRKTKVISNIVEDSDEDENENIINNEILNIKEEEDSSIEIKIKKPFNKKFKFYKKKK